MTGDTELDRLFLEWRQDIDSVPFPVIDVPSLPRMPRQRPSSESRAPGAETPAPRRGGSCTRYGWSPPGSRARAR